MWSFASVFCFFSYYVFKVYSSCSTYQNFTHFYDQIIFHCMEIPHFVYPLSVCGHLGCFHFLAIMNNATMNIHIKVFMWMHIFNFLAYIT